MINLESRVQGSSEYMYRWAEEGSDIVNGTSGLSHSLMGNEDLSETDFVDSMGSPVAKFSWFNGAYNSTNQPCKANSTYLLNEDEMTISIAFSHQNFTDGNISIDPYFSLLQPSNLLSLLMVYGISIANSGQSTSNLMLFGGILVAVVLVSIAVILVRRR